MPAHYLLTAASRKFGLLDIMKMTDQEIIQMFKQARWPDTHGTPCCPVCASPAYGPNIRSQYKCKKCKRLFSVTSGTAIHGMKLPHRKLLIGIMIWATTAKGMSTIQMARYLDVQHKTAFTLIHKLRHGLVIEAKDLRIGGKGKHSAADGCYIGGYVRQHNYKQMRKDRRFSRNKSPKRRVVIVARETSGLHRTLVCVVKRESDGVAFLRKVIKPGTIIHADEAPSWDRLSGWYEMRRINHEFAYSHDGACSNIAESFFSRLRLLERGQHHHISGPYLGRYATETAFREDHRRLSAYELTVLLLRLTLNAPSDPEFRGYWQRRLRGRFIPWWRR